MSEFIFNLFWGQLINQSRVNFEYLRGITILIVNLINQFVKNDIVKESLDNANAFLKDAIKENNAEKIEYLMMIKEQFENATCEVKDYVATLRFNNPDFSFETIITATDDELIYNDKKRKFECDIAA